MTSILLTTLNARYSHASLGLRYLLANMGELREQTHLLEFTIKQRPVDIVEQLLAYQPQIIGIGVYIWNARESLEVVSLLKKIRPEITVVLGGPEVSYECDQQTICQLADYIITGQGDLTFNALCQQLLQNQPPAHKIIPATTPALDSITLPYAEYSDDDLQHRIVYVEASRGCPFKCEFCLSALDKTATPFELNRFLDEMDRLYQRGLRHFKFVDRTFNLKVENSLQIMDFFLQRLDESLFLHFELIPDHLPERLQQAIQRFPPGSLQFEIGVQSLNPDVQKNISRKQNNEKTAENLYWLRNETDAHIHADLIIGLPGEDMESFAQGFDQLYAMRPHEIQVGILKRLRGSPVIRHTDEFQLRFSPLPPYNILSTDCIDFATMQRLSRFARYWDIIANSGRFKQTLPLMLAEQPFDNFLKFSDWLYTETGQTDRIHLARLFTLLNKGIQDLFSISAEQLNPAMLIDYESSALKGTPTFLQPINNRHEKRAQLQANRRQERHQ